MSTNQWNLFSSESVSEGHPDKVADQISDAILDEYLKGDRKAKVACETLVTTGLVVVAGEVFTHTPVHFDVQEVIRGVIEDIGYNEEGMGFSHNSCAVLNALHAQSQDIRQGVELSGDEVGAGDQGMMFGYATNETKDFMPLPIDLSHKLTHGLAKLRKSGKLPWLRPDAKSQVTIAYDENGKPARVHTVVLSTQHSPDVELDEIKAQIREELINKIIPSELSDNDMICHINPTGRFVIGGPHGDAGLTGRKIIVDTYGGAAPHGGGAFSGKDPSKVDRSAAYATRYIAKNIVAAGLADRFQVQLSYAIGVAEPVGIYVEDFGTGKVDLSKMATAVREIFPLKPAAIICELKLDQPQYRQTAAYGHFGREEPTGFQWEKCDRVDQLKSYFKV